MGENSQDQARKEKNTGSSEKMRWYVVHVYSGMEKSVASKALGHKSKRSIDYYLNDIPAKARINQNVFNAPSGELEEMRINKLGRIYMKNR